MNDHPLHQIIDKALAAFESMKKFTGSLQALTISAGVVEGVFLDMKRAADEYAKRKPKVERLQGAQPAVPEGMVLVPVEPTERMLCAGFGYWLNVATHPKQRATAVQAWADMLAAAQKPASVAGLAQQADAPDAHLALAHELWALAQLAPGEGIEDGAERIAARLAKSAPVQQAGEREAPSRDEAIRVWRKHCRSWASVLGTTPVSPVIDAMLEFAALSAPASAQERAVYGWAYTINGAHQGFVKGTEPPPHDSYDSGTLVALYSHTAPVKGEPELTKKLIGYVSEHTGPDGPYKWQFSKTLSGVYLDTALRVIPVYEPASAHIEEQLDAKLDLVVKIQEFEQTVAREAVLAPEMYLKLVEKAGVLSGSPG